MNKYIDLHMHSIYSDDGEFTPAKLVEKCAESGVKIMAIADHNSVKGIAEGLETAQKKGIKYIPAVEIDCTYKDINLHVVGYGIDYQDPIFEQIENNVLEQELSSSKEKIKLTKKLGFEIDEKRLGELSDNGVYTGEMFAELLLNDTRYLDHPMLKPYRDGGDRGDNPYVNFYWDYYAQGKPCYTKIEYPTLEEVVKIIHDHGGVAVLAHPGNNLKGQFEIFTEMVAVGLDGVEAFSSYHSPQTSDYFYQTGSKLGLLITCGSDYHGKTKPSIELGGCGGSIDQHQIEEKLQEMKLI